MFTIYSGDLKSDHSNSGNIWYSDFLKVGYQMVHFSNGQALAIGNVIVIALPIEKPDLSKSRCFLLDFKWFLTEWQPFIPIWNGPASGFQILLEIWIVCNSTYVKNSKSRPVRISDPHCTYIIYSSISTKLGTSESRAIYVYESM